MNYIKIMFDYNKLNDKITKIKDNQIEYLIMSDETKNQMELTYKLGMFKGVPFEKMKYTYMGITILTDNSLPFGEILIVPKEGLC